MPKSVPRPALVSALIDAVIDIIIETVDRDMVEGIIATLIGDEKAGGFRVRYSP